MLELQHMKCVIIHYHLQVIPCLQVFRIIHIQCNTATADLQFPTCTIITLHLEYLEIIPSGPMMPYNSTPVGPTNNNASQHTVPLNSFSTPTFSSAGSTVQPCNPASATTSTTCNAPAIGGVQLHMITYVKLPHLQPSLLLHL